MATEIEAKEKICLLRLVGLPTIKPSYLSQMNLSQCLGSNCMTYWIPCKDDSKKGYCGASGIKQD